MTQKIQMMVEHLEGGFNVAELPGASVIPRGWLLIGFGRMYQDSQPR
ncbi:MAG: hypothetical protein RL693_2426 [Verrucomicrobiota bacterium]